MDYKKYMYIVWILIGLLEYVSTYTGRTAMYHLATPNKPCQLPVNKDANTDLICRYQEFSTGTTCLYQSIRWIKDGWDGTFNITDSRKYGTWQNIPGWGLRAGEHISILRVRDIKVQDAGSYICEITCRMGSGQTRTVRHTAEICVNKPDSDTLHCMPKETASFCRESFKDDICNLECDSENGLYDGFDCVDIAVPCKFEDYCKQHFGDGTCDNNCDNSACAWDGGDCGRGRRSIADGALAIVFYQRPKTIKRHIKKYMRLISQSLRTVLRVILNSKGEQEIYPWRVDNVLRNVSMYYEDPDEYTRESRGSVVYLQIDNSNCKRRCFRDVHTASQFIASLINQGWDPGIPWHSVGALTRIDEQRCPNENNTVLNMDLQNEGSPSQNTNSNNNDDGEVMVETWVLIAAIGGGALFLILVLVLIFTIYKLSNDKQKRRTKRDEMYNIKDRKYKEGTHV
ncbi:unnamed protein product [Owenia fusiformis]|uniref:Uncharacterized protein n=1 Tax=Owenia fusiformis TaxID=6347 RepID=A0A8J1XKE0_OWEFU|nr:unnamed protein product [Owenia fusiformis]